MIQGITDAAIYADSDVVFVKPIDELWAYLKKFNSREVMAIAPTAGHALGGSRYNENFILHDTGLFQINSGSLDISSRGLSDNSQSQILKSYSFQLFFAQK